MENSQLAILLLIVCLALLAAEVFIPSGGMLLVSSGVCLAGSMWFAWKSWWPDYPVWWWSYIGAVVVAIPAAVLGILFVFPRTSIGRRMLLDAPSPGDVTAYAEEIARLKSLVGERGQTVTLLNPGGIVLVAGERHHCESDGLMIDPRQDVEVVGVSGNRLVVRLPASEAEPDPQSPNDSDRPTDGDALDFELPRE